MPSLTLWGVKPDLMLLVVVSWNLVRGVRDGVVWGIIGGIMLDFVSGAPFGGHTIALFLASFLAGLGGMSVFRFGLALPVVIVLLSTIAYDLFLAAFLSLVGWPIQWLDLIVEVVLPSIVLNLLATPFVFWAIRSLHRLTGPARIEWE